MASTDPSKYVLNHTMLRVKDPQRSIEFYKLLGLQQILKFPNPDAKFDLYYLAYDGPHAVSKGQDCTGRQGVLELTHNYGSETDPNFKVNNGNADPHKGFGHICVSVDNIQAACKRLEDSGVKFQKRLSDGRMRNIAFALDPDGYWVEIVGQKDTKETEEVTTTDVGTYRFNHTMIRVKDPEASLKFYQDTMGMKLVRTSENKDAKFNLYFLCYEKYQGENTPQPQREGLLELTWNYGTEKEEGFKYHNGNDEPQGFGHICVSVDDLDAACARLEDKGVRWKKRLTEGRMKMAAFVLDPDGYWVGIIQNREIKKTD